ncbi:hypothetical protein BCL79_3836 [Stenotrophomonas rhizophila]|uniref:Uncharacterized protein n=1 Tax=Stenotrophomonas rhizophila TaxID=216778 RepID=A0A498BWD1_9GAMM|nr:hypothetical protein BCL79_3836 [Stenotrophomonas rhizophila]
MLDSPWLGRARVGCRDPLQVRPCKLICRHPWRHMVPPTHPCPPFDNGLVRNGKAAPRRRLLICSAFDLLSFDLLGFDLIGVDPPSLIGSALLCSASQTPRQFARRAWLRSVVAALCHVHASTVVASTGSIRLAQQQWRRSAEPPVALTLATSPLSEAGCGWVCGTICRHGWRHMSPHGWVHGGSRAPTHTPPGQAARQTKAPALKLSSSQAS